MKIALDAMGGDFAPDAIVEGAVLAANDLPADAQIVLIGDQARVEAALRRVGARPGPRLIVQHAPDVIEMGEHPAKAFTQKPQSSIAVGYGLLKAGEVAAFCSAGNTGAMMVGALFSVKALPGVKRVGLLNIGEEEGKGTMDVQEAYQLLKANAEVRFIGNIEGRDIFLDKCDVIVCDGFTGNVVLKMAESIYDIMAERGIQDDYFARYNYEAVGGSPILGVNGNVVIGHGVSSPMAAGNMVKLGYQMAAAGVLERFRRVYAAS